MVRLARPCRAGGVNRLHHDPWWSVAALVLGAVWLLTGLVSSGRFGQDLGRAGADPRAARPALWVQRVLGLVLLALGIFGLIRR